MTSKLTQKSPNIDFRQHLTECHITREGPGTILKDLHFLMRRIGGEGVKTKSKRGNLPASLLAQINANLAQPIEIQLARPLLRDYPNIAGLYILLRVLELIRVEGSRVLVDAARLRTWQELNPCEQYFALMEAWLFDADSQVLGGEQGHRDLDGLLNTLLFLAKSLSSRWKTFPEWVHTYPFGGGGVSTWNVQLMLALGLIEVMPRPLANRSPQCPSRGWMMWKAKRTPWGDALTAAMLHHWCGGDHAVDDLISLAFGEGFEPGAIRTIFHPYFPELRNSFGPPPPVVHPGVYHFKVGYHRRYGPPGVWRRMAVPDTATLYDVCDAILKAFKFWDDDHMHRFRYRDRAGRSRVYLHPWGEEEPFSNEVTLGETDLPEKGRIEFTFDFGSTWKFDLKLERIAPPDQNLECITILESEGAPLPQYDQGNGED